MGVIPRVAILERPKLVSNHISLGNRALCDAIDAIHLPVVRVQLANSVLVDGRAILIVVVPNMNNKLVTPASLDQRTRELFVVAFPAGLLKSFREQGHVPTNLKKVFPGDTWWHSIGTLVCVDINL